MGKLLTCLVKDDFSGLLLLYRKILSTDFEMIGLNTAYDRKNQKFVMDQDLISSFPKFAYLGPTPIYEDYVTMSNFPHWIDLDDYTDNIINLDIMEHVKTHHLEQIFPKQRTEYMHTINVRKPEFDKAQKEINKEHLNICLNIFDPIYDKDISLQYDMTYILSKLETEIDKKIVVWIVGIIHKNHSDKLEGIVTDTLMPFGFEVRNYTGNSLSEQMAILLNSQLLISGPYGLGLLAYTAKVPSFIVYPFTMYGMKGNTVDPTRKNFSYIETTDEEMFTDVPKVIDLVKKQMEVK